MFGFLFKFIVLPILLLCFAATGITAYLVLTPIDQGNVKTRIWQACMVGSYAQTANNWGRRNARPVYSSVQCTCAGDTIVASMGAPVSAAGAEAVRGFIEDGLRSWVTGGNFRILRNSPRGQIADAFVNSASRLSRTCIGQNG